MAFHDRLKQARKNVGMTQETVANLLGIAKSTYSGYETGKSEPPMNAIANLMRFFSVSADWLWQDELEKQFENEYPKRHLPAELTDWNAKSQDEIELLKSYRSLNTNGKNAILVTVRAFAENPDMQKEKSDELAI